MKLLIFEYDLNWNAEKVEELKRSLTEWQGKPERFRFILVPVFNPKVCFRIATETFLYNRWDWEDTDTLIDRIDPPESELTEEQQKRKEFLSKTNLGDSPNKENGPVQQIQKIFDGVDKGKVKNILENMGLEQKKTNQNRNKDILEGVVSKQHKITELQTMVKELEKEIANLTIGLGKGEEYMRMINDQLKEKSTRFEHIGTLEVPEKDDDHLKRDPFDEVGNG